MTLILIGAMVLLLMSRPLLLRIELSRAKHRSLAGHARLGRLISRMLPFYEFDEHQFFQADGAPEDVARQRRTAFTELATLYAQRFPITSRLTQEAQTGIADLQFTSRYRVPFQFSRMVRQHLSPGAFVQSSSGPILTDLDGNRFYDLTGSYGVNVFGYEFYKGCIERGMEQARQ